MAMSAVAVDVDLVQERKLVVVKARINASDYLFKALYVPAEPVQGQSFGTDRGTHGTFINSGIGSFRYNIDGVYVQVPCVMISPIEPRERLLLSGWSEDRHPSCLRAMAGGVITTRDQLSDAMMEMKPQPGQPALRVVYAGTEYPYLFAEGFDDFVKKAFFYRGRPGIQAVVAKYYPNARMVSIVATTKHEQRYY